MADREIMVVAGEVSGDQHAADLVAALQRREPGLRFFGMGGLKLAERGVDRLYGAEEISVMGLVEVVPKLRRILQVMRGLRDEAARRRPAAALLVDIPDFNLRLARELKRLKIPVVYYVSPSVWAWRQGRVRQIAERVDRMLCILPFEEEFYRQRGVSASYVGSPVLEQVPPPAPAEEFRRRLGLDPARPTLALLPGSRMGEIRRILPAMAQAARALSADRPGLQVALPVAPSIADSAVAGAFEGSTISPVLVRGRAPEVVGASDVTVVASGTATLEAGLMERPLVVVYRMAPLTFAVAKRAAKVPFVSLVNLLLGRRVVPELLQGAMTPEAIAREASRLFSGPDRDQMVSSLKELRRVLGPPGAADRAAEAVLTVLG